LTKNSASNQAAGKRAADLFNRAGEASKKVGIQFGYHNHSFEFDPRIRLAECSLMIFSSPKTDPKLVAMD